MLSAFGCDPSCGRGRTASWQDGILMGEDISAEFEPLEDTRKKILTDVDLLNRVLDVWKDHLNRYFGYAPQSCKML
jgi:hypothetical protein